MTWSRSAARCLTAGGFNNVALRKDLSLAKSATRSRANYCEVCFCRSSPAVPPAVSYPHVPDEQSNGAKLLRQCSRATRGRDNHCGACSLQGCTRCSTSGFLPARAGLETIRCEAVGTMYPHRTVATQPVRREGDCQPQGGRGLGMDRMVKISESPYTRRHCPSSARG
jgi:hypothetical protein